MGSRTYCGEARIALPSIWYCFLMGLLFSLPIVVQAATPGVTLVNFFDLPNTLRLKLISTISERKTDDPAASAVLEKIMVNFDAKELARRMGAVLERNVSEEDITRFGAMSSSPSGKRISAAFKRYKDPQSLTKALSALPREDQMLFQEKTMKNIFATIKSEEMKQVGIDYVADLTCTWAKRNSRADILERLAKAGKCTS